MTTNPQTLDEILALLHIRKGGVPGISKTAPAQKSYYLACEHMDYDTELESKSLTNYDKEVKKALSALRQLIDEKLPKDYVPEGHEPEACINHEKYTSACCGCQRQKTRVHTLADVKRALSEVFGEKE